MGTPQLTLTKVRELVPTVLDADGVARVSRTLDAITTILQEGKKSMRLKVRARVGDRLRWYQLPDELNG